MFSPWAIQRDPRLHPNAFRSVDAYKDAVSEARFDEDDDEEHPWTYLRDDPEPGGLD